MKTLIAVLFVALAAVPSHAIPTLGPTPIYRGDFVGHHVLIAQATLPSVSGTAQDPVADIPAGKWAGKLDLTKDFSLGGWQSLKSADQAYGLSKPVWSLQKGGQPLIVVGLFVGFDKPLDPLVSSTPRFLGGDTISVPGSTLDWALGTKWGDEWAPKLKTGVLFAHDLSRLNKTHLFGDFVGIGASYPLGG